MKVKLKKRQCNSRYDLYCVIYGGGGQSNTSVVHMHDQRFSKHTLIETYALEKKHPLNKNFVQLCTQFVHLTKILGAFMR